MESFIVSTFEVQLVADIALMESPPICTVPKADLLRKHAAFHTARVLVISLTSGPVRRRDRALPAHDEPVDMS